jgi:hypothetical protein
MAQPRCSLSTQTDPATSAAPQPSDASARKVDLLTTPGLALLVGCVLAAMGNSRDSALLTWQLPLALMALALAYVGVKALRARRS